MYFKQNQLVFTINNQIKCLTQLLALDENHELNISGTSLNKRFGSEPDLRIEEEQQKSKNNNNKHFKKKYRAPPPPNTDVSLITIR